MKPNKNIKHNIKEIAYTKRDAKEFYNKFRKEFNINEVNFYNNTNIRLEELLSCKNIKFLKSYKLNSYNGLIYVSDEEILDEDIKEIWTSENYRIKGRYCNGKEFELKEAKVKDLISIEDSIIFVTFRYRE